MGHWLGCADKLSHGVIFNLSSAKVCSPAMIETYFYYDKDIWITVTDYCIHPDASEWILWFSVCYAAIMRRESFNVNALSGKLH